MNRLSFSLRQRAILVAKVTAGISFTGAAAFYLVTRNCYFEPFGPENDGDFFKHPLLKQINPWDKPASCDSCVREIPFARLDAAVLEDARKGGALLIERFAGGMWGGFGYAIQRRIMEFFKDETNKDDIWLKEDLLRCKYEPGTYFTNHFLVLSKTPTCITMRGCFNPRQSPPAPMSTDNLVEMRADLNEENMVVVLRLKIATFDGTEQASDEKDPFGGIGGWLHKRYSTLLVESGAQNCMK